MAENNWSLLDGRSILIEFEAAATERNWGWWSRGADGSEFDAAATEWTEHAWLRGGQMVQAAEAGGGVTIISATLSASGIGSTSFSAEAFYLATLASSGAASSNLSGASVVVGSLASSGSASSSLIGESVSIISGTLSSSGAATTDLLAGSLGVGVLDAAGSSALDLQSGAIASSVLESGGSSSTRLIGEGGEASAPVEIRTPGMIPLKDRWKTPRKVVEARMDWQGRAATTFGSGSIGVAILEVHSVAKTGFLGGKTEVVQIPRRMLPLEVVLLAA